MRQVKMAGGGALKMVGAPAAHKVKDEGPGGSDDGKPGHPALAERQHNESGQQRADGAAYPAVRPDVFEKAELIVPSETIAARFNEIAEPMLRAVARNQMIAKTLAKLRDTLLPRLISGKLRVPEAEKLVEAAL